MNILINASEDEVKCNFINSNRSPEEICMIQEIMLDHSISKFFGSQPPKNVEFADIKEVKNKHIGRHKATGINIAVLLTGGWRTHDTGFNKTKYNFSDSHLCNFDAHAGKLINNVHYFIVADDLDVDKTIKTYPGAKMIYLTDKKKMVLGDEINFTVNQGHVDAAITKMEKLKKFYWTYPQSHLQWEKLRMGYEMMEYWEDTNDIYYNFVVRVRPDCIIRNITEKFISDVVQKYRSLKEFVIFDWDFFAFGSRRAMRSFTEVIFHYGDYFMEKNNYKFETNGLFNYSQYVNLNKPQWTFAPEVQLAEHLLKVKFTVFDIDLEKRPHGDFCTPDPNRFNENKKGIINVTR